MVSRLVDSCASDRSGSSSAIVSPAQDGRVVAALEEYEQLLRSGQRPGRAEFLGRHPSIAHILCDRLEGLEFVQNAMRPLADTGPAGLAIDDTFLPAMLGEYRIIREVGRGGMGVVYEANHLPLGRRVALKVLPSTASLDRRQRERFQVEAQAAALLHHEHIVPVFGIGCDQGIHYYAMQFIEGRSMTDVIRSLCPPPPAGKFNETKTWDPTLDLDSESVDSGAVRNTGSSLNNRRHSQMVAQLGLQAALALEHAHEIGVIHRDIKPSNLLIDDRNHLWIADFGLARLPHETHNLTRTGDLVGTLRYMSPEQLRGERVLVDARADIYALGATLYELLTLRPAFEACDRNELVRKILEEEPIHPRRFNASIPRDLETIVLKAMEKEPTVRYDSARALAADLRRFLDDQPIQARRPSLFDQAVKWSRRHRAAVVASTLALLVTFAAVLVTFAVSNAALRQANLRLRLHERAAQNTLDHSLGTLDQLIRPLTGDTSHSGKEDATRALPIAIQYCDRVTEIFALDRSMQEVAAKSFRQAGYYRMILGRPRGREDYRAAIDIYEKTCARSPTLLWLPAGLIETLEEYAGLLTEPVDAAESEMTFRRALRSPSRGSTTRPLSLIASIFISSARSIIWHGNLFAGRPPNPVMPHWLSVWRARPWIGRPSSVLTGTPWASHITAPVIGRPPVEPCSERSNSAREETPPIGSSWRASSTSRGRPIRPAACTIGPRRCCGGMRTSTWPRPLS